MSARFRHHLTWILAAAVAYWLWGPIACSLVVVSCIVCYELGESEGRSCYRGLWQPPAVPRAYQRIVERAGRG